ncbi:MAGE family-domain-containing protein [Gloeopeniophorella convolvens]|nr:MAGE family-domain-containing protein [Gloeopeniophorella convolvens]
MARAGPSRSQRARAQVQLSTPEMEDEEMPPSDDEAMLDELSRALDEGDKDMNKRANDLVRLALFNEQRRLPLRRDEISKKVLGQRRGQFKTVFERAQQTLRLTFGMELVELPTRSATAADRSQTQTQTQTQGGDDDGERAVTGLRKKVAAQGSKTYILRSTLDPALISYAAQPHKRVREVEAAAIDPDAEGGVEEPHGALLAAGENPVPLGVLHVVLALVLASGRVLPDGELRALLRRLRLHPTTPLPLPGAPHRPLTLELLLSQLQRQGYLDRMRAGPAPAAAPKRGRLTNTQGHGDDDGAAWEWRWGPRAHAEVGEAAVGRFVAEFMAERSARGAGADEEDEDEEDGGNRRRGRGEEAQKRYAAILKGFERSAGGALAGVTE